MNSLEEIQACITQLPQVEMGKLADWLQMYLDEAWDRKIEEDAKSNRLDKIIQLAGSDIATGRVKPLDAALIGG
jgi:hypothetical protein